ncbi:MAG TPA: hypothetical protein VGD98_20515 [Ktedonobacteraceae bacterium]
MRNWKSYLSTPLTKARNLPWKGKIGLVLCFTAVVALTTGARAFTSVSPNTYYACMDNTTKALELSDASSTCSTSSSKISWQQQGTKGEPGPGGPAGPAGPKGDSGPPGPAGFATQIFRTAGGIGPFVIATLWLPRGTYLLEGTAQVNEFSGNGRADGSCSFSRSDSDSIPDVSTAPPNGSEVLTMHDTLDLSAAPGITRILFFCRPSENRLQSVNSPIPQPRFAYGSISFSRVVFTAISGQLFRQ